MRLLPVLFTSFVIAFAANADSKDLKLHAQLKVIESYGPNVQPRTVRTLKQWDLSPLVKGINPSRSSDGVGLYAPRAVICVNLQMRLDQDEARSIHSDYLKAELSRGNLKNGKKQKLSIEKNYLHTYQYSITCRYPESDLSDLDVLTGWRPDQLREHVVKHNKEYATKPAASRRNIATPID